MLLMQIGIQIGTVKLIQIKQISGAQSTGSRATQRKSVGRAGRVLRTPRTVHNKITDQTNTVGTTGRPHIIQKTVGTQMLQTGIRAVVIEIIITITIARISKDKITMEITKTTAIAISEEITGVGITTNKTEITIITPMVIIIQMVIITQAITTIVMATIITGIVITRVRTGAVITIIITGRTIIGETIITV